MRTLLNIMLKYEIAGYRKNCCYFGINRKTISGYK